MNNSDENSEEDLDCLSALDDMDTDYEVERTESDEDEGCGDACKI